MAATSKIEWTDATLNAIAGCRKVSPECDSCYAIGEAWRMKSNPNEKISGKYLPVVSNRSGVPNWTGKVTFTEDVLLQPLRRRKPTKYFVNSVSDLFYERVLDEWIDKHFAVFALAPQHIFQVLTKRPYWMLDYLTRYHVSRDHNCADFVADAVAARRGRPGATGADRTDGTNFQWPLPNVWLGCSVGSQKYADERREAMRAISELGWTTWVSYEPAIGPVDWTGWEFLDWIVSGGESGTEARLSHPDWHRATRDFCLANGIAYHFKQWGKFAPSDVIRLDHPDYDPNDDVLLGAEIGRKKHARILDGREWNEFPEVSS